MTDPNAVNPNRTNAENPPPRTRATKRQWVYVAGSLIAFIAAIAVVATI